MLFLLFYFDGLSLLMADPEDKDPDDAPVLSQQQLKSIADLVVERLSSAVQPSVASSGSGVTASDTPTGGEFLE